MKDVLVGISVPWKARTRVSRYCSGVMLSGDSVPPKGDLLNHSNPCCSPPFKRAGSEPDAKACWKGLVSACKPSKRSRGWYGAQNGLCTLPCEWGPAHQ